MFPNQSWTEIRKLVSSRRVQVHGNLCLDERRKVNTGDVIKIVEHSLPKLATTEDVRIVYLDEHLVVIQKPAGVTTLRHREETDLPQRRKQLQPTLDELVRQRLAEELGITESRGTKGRARKDRRLELRPVHRLDRDTSGLMIFARTPPAEQRLVRMFARHDVQRAYVAVVHGRVEAQTIDTWLIRDRGDGLRGSTTQKEKAEGALHAVTHVRPMEHFDDYTVLECRLETGRTHQIRIHLSEIGHPLCGEKVYTHLPGKPPHEDTSGAPRQALHAAELAFVHPITGQALRFRMPLPADLKGWLLRMRRK